MRHAVHVVQHDHGAIRGPQLIDRGGQYRGELGLSRWVITARRLKVRREAVPRYFALSAAAAPHLAVGCVCDNAIDPCPELYDLFRVRLAAGVRTASRCARAPYVLPSASAASTSAARRRLVNSPSESFKPLPRSIPTRASGAALSSPLMAQSTAIRARRNAGHASECRREVTGGPKAQQPTDLSDRELRLPE
jgi:hypothetical protein